MNMVYKSKGKQWVKTLHVVTVIVRFQINANSLGESKPCVYISQEGDNIQVCLICIDDKHLSFKRTETSAVFIK